MNATIQDLLQILGEKEVQIQLLQREVARLAALVPKEPAAVGPEALGPRPVAAER